jgi:putative FmdB family regulatory protein
MPIYEYQCKACDHVFDTLQKLSDPPLRKCPECGRLKLTKLVSAAGFRLKGKGWYETDFKSAKRRNIAGDDTAGGEGKTEAANGKSDKQGKDNASAKPKDKPAKSAGDSSSAAA